MIPRYIDKDSRGYEIYRFCSNCGGAVTKDVVTEKWDRCHLCNAKPLKTLRISYGLMGKG